MLSIVDLTKLKHPTLSAPIRIKSDAAIKSAGDAYHTFILPIIGDYSHNFSLVSNYVYKGPEARVDCLGNYLDHVTLTLNNRTTILSCVDAPPRVEQLPVVPLSIIRLDFLNLPLLTKCATESSFMINVKFKQSPITSYMLVYDVMFADEPELQQEYFSVAYLSQQAQKTTKRLDLIFDRGTVTSL